MGNRKTVLITGTSKGIGRTTARFFQRQGWNVVATMRTPRLELHTPIDEALSSYERGGIWAPRQS